MKVSSSSSKTASGPLDPSELLTQYKSASKKVDSEIQKAKSSLAKDPKDPVAGAELQEALQEKTRLTTLFTNLLNTLHETMMQVLRQLSLRA